MTIMNIHQHMSKYKVERGFRQEDTMLSKFFTAVEELEYAGICFQTTELATQRYKHQWRILQPSPVCRRCCPNKS